MKVFIIILLFISILITVAFFTLLERKLIAAIQRREGPNIVGYWGLLQPFSDGLKLLIKEIIVPIFSNHLLFYIGPIISFIISLFAWGFIPLQFHDITFDTTYSLLYLYILSSFNVYGLIIAGWASLSKYSLYGALRAINQIISYEISFGILILIITLLLHSLNFLEIIYFQKLILGWLVIFVFPLGLIFLISSIAETNRAPFDLPEAEAEIVAGYNLEYAGFIFALFFLGEYSNILIITALFSILFLGGWGWCLYINSFIIKMLGLCLLFVVVRAVFPRYRYDQLLKICWLVFLPVNFIYLLWLIIVFLVN